MHLDPSPARDGARFESESSVWHHFLLLLWKRLLFKKSFLLLKYIPMSFLLPRKK